MWSKSQVCCFVPYVRQGDYFHFSYQFWNGHCFKELTLLACQPHLAKRICGILVYLLIYLLQINSTRIQANNQLQVNTVREKIVEKETTTSTDAQGIPPLIKI